MPISNPLGSSRPLLSRKRKPRKKEANLPTDRPPIETSANPTPTNLTLIDRHDKRHRVAALHKIPAPLRDGAVFVLPHGERYCQPVYAPPPPGRVGLDILLKGDSSRKRKRGEDNSFDYISEHFDDFGTSGGATNSHTFDRDNFKSRMDMDAVNHVRTELKNFRRHGRDRMSQWEKWRSNVIPSLISPFLEHQRRTAFGRLPSEATRTPCSCTGTVEITITLSDWNSTCFSFLFSFVSHR